MMTTVGIMRKTIRQKGGWGVGAFGLHIKSNSFSHLEEYKKMPKSAGLIPAEPGPERNKIRTQLCNEWQAWCSKYRETNPNEYRPICKSNFETYCNPDEPNSDEPNSDEPNSDEPNSDEPNSDKPRQVYTAALSGDGTQTVPLIPKYPKTGLDKIKNPKIRSLEKERFVEICKFINIINKTPVDMKSLLPIRLGIAILTRALDHYGLQMELLRVKLKNISTFIVENSESTESPIPSNTSTKTSSGYPSGSSSPTTTGSPIPYQPFNWTGTYNSKKDGPFIISTYTDTSSWSVTEEFRKDLSSLLKDLLQKKFGLGLSSCESVLKYVNSQTSGRHRFSNFVNKVNKRGSRRKQRRTRRRNVKH